ncbi:lipopolysaccharide assembly LapA domain-containing protein [Paenibacillus tarimensis]
MKTQWIIISALLFALITAIFAVINVDPVEVNFGFGKTQTPLILVILASTLLGGLTVFLFAIIRQFKQHRKIRQLEKELAALTAGSDTEITGKAEPAVEATDTSSGQVNGNP